MFDRFQNLWRKGTSSLTDAVERRRAARTSSTATAVCRADRVGLPPTEVRVRDVSSAGLSFLTERPVGVGTMVTLELPGEPGPAAVLACVRREAPDGEGGWIVGCSFAAELGEADLAGFGVTRSKPSTQDQRRWTRVVPATGRVVFRRLAETPASPTSARILNISPAGIGFVTDARAEPGTLLDLELIGGPDQPGLTVLASVVYATPHSSGGWVLGCTFIRELSDAELRALC